MCSLCGTLGGKGHWTDTSSTPDAFRASTVPMTSQRERRQRVALVNKILKHYALTLEDWEGTSYLLRSRTGRTEIVNNLSDMWAMAETMIHRPCDPLDPRLLSALSGGSP